MYNAREFSFPDAVAEAPMSIRPDKAWTSVFVAGNRGEPVTTCPFRRGMLMVSWRSGWRSGLREREQEERSRLRTNDARVPSGKA